METDPTVNLKGSGWEGDTPRQLCHGVLRLLDSLYDKKVTEKRSIDDPEDPYSRHDPYSNWEFSQVFVRVLTEYRRKDEKDNSLPIIPVFGKSRKFVHPNVFGVIDLEPEVIEAPSRKKQKASEKKDFVGSDYKEHVQDNFFGYWMSYQDENGGRQKSNPLMFYIFSRYLSAGLPERKKGALSLKQTTIEHFWDNSQMNYDLKDMFDTKKKLVNAAKSWWGGKFSQNKEEHLQMIAFTRNTYTLDPDAETLGETFENIKQGDFDKMVKDFSKSMHPTYWKIILYARSLYNDFRILFRQSQINKTSAPNKIQATNEFKASVMSYAQKLVEERHGHP